MPPTCVYAYQKRGEHPGHSVLTCRITSAQSYIPGGHEAAVRYDVRRAATVTHAGGVASKSPGITMPYVRVGIGSETPPYIALTSFSGRSCGTEAGFHVLLYPSCLAEATS